MKKVLSNHCYFIRCLNKNRRIEEGEGNSCDQRLSIWRLTISMKSFSHRYYCVSQSTSCPKQMRVRMCYPVLYGEIFLPGLQSLQQATKTELDYRVAIKIQLRKNFAEQARNCFRYSAEKSVPFVEFCVSRNSPFRVSERNGMEFRVIFLIKVIPVGMHNFVL